MNYSLIVLAIVVFNIVFLAGLIAHRGTVKHLPQETERKWHGCKAYMSKAWDFLFPEDKMLANIRSTNREYVECFSNPVRLVAVQGIAILKQRLHNKLQALDRSSTQAEEEAYVVACYEEYLEGLLALSTLLRNELQDDCSRFSPDFC